jgi:hypothetical protein
MRILMIALSTLLSFSALQAQEAPEVFMLGMQEKTYEELTKTYKQTLLEVCGNKMEVAFKKWLGMMQDMEAYSDQVGYNIDGLKLLLHVFWNEDGRIAHLGYFIRPNSRNVDTKELSAFFSSFIRQYKFPLTSDRKFMHYTKASFPTFDERAQR